jgi:high-affinity iron transporter
VTSLVTVALVTSMIFWMRRAARGLSGDLRERVGGALAVGGPALIFTAFVAVAREGLEAALFVWTNAQAAGSSTSPLLGAVIGLVLATGICVGLYRRVLNLAFNLPGRI